MVGKKVTLELLTIARLVSRHRSVRCTVFSLPQRWLPQGHTIPKKFNGPRKILDYDDWVIPDHLFLAQFSLKVHRDPRLAINQFLQKVSAILELAGMDLKLRIPQSLQLDH